MIRGLAGTIFISCMLFAQDQELPAEQERPSVSAEQTATIPSGTKVLMVMKNTVTSKNARQGDGVYLETTFPAS